MKIPLDDLAKYSPWPARLLGTEPWVQRSKSQEEVLREYEKEKWAQLLEKIDALHKPLALADVHDHLLANEKPILCLRDGEFLLLSPREALTENVLVASKALASLAQDDIDSIVELGAGFGQMILNAATKFPGKRIVAGELSAAGREIIRRLADSMQLDVAAVPCDIRAESFEQFPLPPNSLVFTSYVTSYLEEGAEVFLRRLCNLRPAVVAHFEPLYEHCPPDTLLGLMRRRYIEVNGYNRDLLTVLQAMETKGEIEILKADRDLFALNPVYVPSLTVWRPV